MMKSLMRACLLISASALTACSTLGLGPESVRTEFIVTPQPVMTGVLPTAYPLILTRAPIDPDGSAPVRGVIQAGSNAAKQYGLCAVHYNSVMGLIRGHNSAAAQTKPDDVIDVEPE